MRSEPPEDFEEWATWFDSHKDADGSINLDKHPDLAKYITEKMQYWDDLCDHFGVP